MEFMAILSAATHRLAEILRSANILGVIICICTIGAVRTILGTRKRYTKLQGPSSTSLLFGVGKDILDSPDPSAVYEGWQKQYGAAYEIPMALGKRRVVLHDPKALAHVFNKDMWTYVHTALHKTSLEKTVSWI
ncbi:hypothetical protein ID866_8552 [Astraeus odoratus]|nr:hypothetical protein ID866_8552 [Astraeus odoratus]